MGDAGACWEGSSALLSLLIQMLISEEDVLLDLNPGILALRLVLLSTTLSPTVDRDSSTNLKALT